MPKQNSRNSNPDLRCLFLFGKRSLPFLTVDATIGNQAFGHDRCNIFPRLRYSTASNRFSIVLGRATLKR